MRRRELLTEGALQLEVVIEGGGPAIVLLPSSQRDSFDLDALAGALADAGHTVLRPQPRGMGRSSAPSQGLDLSALAHDVKVVIDRLGQGRAIVAGHAYGHYVARVTDLHHARCVRGVAVLGAAARMHPPWLTQALDVAADSTHPINERLTALRQAFFAPGSDATVWLEGWHPAHRDLYRRAAATPPRDAWWPVSHAPVLDLQGDSDPWRPATTRDELKAVLGDKVTVEVIRGASHALVVEQPQAVADAMVAWARALPE